MNTLGVESFHHMAISVNDMEQMVTFFCDRLGFEIVVEDSHRCGEALDKVVGLQKVDAHVVVLKGYGIHIELLKYNTPEGRAKEPTRQCDHGLVHFCLQVKDIDHAYRRLVQEGVTFNCPPQNLRPRVWATYGHGPENLVFELAQYD